VWKRQNALPPGLRSTLYDPDPGWQVFIVVVVVVMTPTTAYLPQVENECVYPNDQPSAGFGSDSAEEGALSSIVRWYDSSPVAKQSNRSIAPPPRQDIALANFPTPHPLDSCRVTASGHLPDLAGALPTLRIDAHTRDTADRCVTGSGNEMADQGMGG